MKTAVVFARQAVPSDIPGIVELLRQVAKDTGQIDQFSETHAWQHMTSILCNGVSFVALKDTDIVGVLMCSHVDFGYMPTGHLETQHLYVLPSARKSSAAVDLLGAVEDYAKKHEIVVIFHQMDYHSAIFGGPNNSRRVERLFRSRGYEGPVDIAYVGDGQRRVGVSYRR